MAAVDCPGRTERQFLPGQMKQAKRWAAQQTCSTRSLCPGRRPCHENVFIVERKHYIDARVQCVCAPARASRPKAKVKAKVKAKAKKR